MNKEPIEVHTDRAKTSDDRASETQFRKTLTGQWKCRTYLDRLVVPEAHVQAALLP